MPRYPSEPPEGGEESGREATRERSEHAEGGGGSGRESEPRGAKAPRDPSEHAEGGEESGREASRGGPRPPVTKNRSQLFAAAGVFAAAIIAVCVNVLTQRTYKRWDWTESGLYTLSQATLETLHGLSDPVDVIVFLSASDPLNLSVHHMLSAYGAETRLLRPRFVDPDRSPAEFLALQKEYGINAGKTEDGRIVTDASLVIARGAQHWFVTTENMVAYDEKDNQSRPILEQALTEGLRNVLSKEKTLVCFTTGQQEISSDDGGSRGLAEVKFRIQKDNYTTKVVDLTSSDREDTLDGCRVVVVPGPDVPFSAPAAARLETYFAHGGNLFLLMNPVLDDGNRIRDSGLSRVLALAGIELGSDFIVERSPELRLPRGLGETYFATPVEHDITAGLTDGDTPRYRPVVTASQSIRKTKDSLAKALLVTSKDAYSVKDIRPFVEEGHAVEKHAADAQGPFIVAMASERPKPEGSHEKHGARLVVTGSANLAFGQVFRDATLLGDRVFVESALSWLAAKPAIVSVPEKPSHPAGLSLTEDSLGEVLRYVLVYMPGSALALGGIILYRRRSTERKSRKGAPPKTPPRSPRGKEGAAS